MWPTGTAEQRTRARHDVALTTFDPLTLSLRAMLLLGMGKEESALTGGLTALAQECLL